MKHAFLIIAYNNWRQLKSLISLLDDSRNSIFVHIDAKSDDFDQDDFCGVAQRASLHFVPRIKVSWGGISQVDCELLLLKEALSAHCDYYHLLSGMDLPLHDMDYIDDFFSCHQGKEFVHFTESGESVTPQTLKRLSIWYPLQNILGRYAGPFNRILGLMECLLRVNRLKKYPDTIIGKGAQWFSITQDFARYVVNIWPNIKRMFSQTLCPDEIFLQTILLNSPYLENIYHPQPDDDYRAIMRLIDWKRGNPYVYRNDDYEKLISSPLLFARKFDQRVDDKIISRLITYLQK